MIPVILSAGEGSRLSPHTKELPKWLVQIGEKRICDHQISALSSFFDEAYVILGHGFSSFKEAEKQLPTDVEIELKPLVFSNWDETDNAGTAAYALDEIEPDEDLLLICGDIIFDEDTLAHILETYQEGLRKENYSAVVSFRGVQNQRTAIKWNHAKMIVDYGKIRGHREAGIFILNKNHLKSAKSIWNKNKTKWFPIIFTEEESKAIILSEDMKHFEINTQKDLQHAKAMLSDGDEL